jgi:hypothetical protein
MNPSPEQIAEWREKAATAYMADDSVNDLVHPILAYEFGYLRARTEQATEIAELKALAANLKQEAQIHAMEARGANATINEINQFISGATGEPANWHGAQPVKEYVNGLKAQIAELMPLAKFGALVLKYDQNEYFCEEEIGNFALANRLTYTVISNGIRSNIYANIEATIEQLTCTTQYQKKKSDKPFMS